MRYDSTGRPRPTHEKPTHISTGVPGLDFPVESPNPFHGIHAAVARRPRTDDDHGWQPEQRMTREADVVVLSEDVVTCDEVLIPEIRPVLTLVGGEIVYRAW
jgi:predicted amidohydrolase YtcJ